MPQNDDVRFTSSSLKVPLPPQPSPFKFPFCSQTFVSQMVKTRNSLAQLIDSAKTRSDFKRFRPGFSHFWNRSTELSHFESRKSSLLCSASLSLIRSDESTQAESFGTQKSGSRSRYGKEEEQRLLVPKSSLLCSASMALTRPDEPATQGDSSGREAQPKGHSTSRVHDEERVLISEVLVRNKDGEELERKDLEMEALQALKACRANSAHTVLEIQEDVHRIIHSGYFSSCMPVAVDTRDGIKLVFQVEPNQEFQGLVCEGANVLPAKFLEDSLRDGYGKVINLRRLDEAISSINGWYMERGLFALVSAVEILSGGILRLQVSEAEVNKISIHFLDRKTGEPTTGKTKPETILRQLTTKKGQVYSMLQGKRDVDTVLTMGIMEDVSIIPQPADTGKVDMVMNVVERPNGGFSAGGGISSGITSGPLSGLIGSFAYSHRNVFGRNQKLNISLERGQIDSIFRINYTDPWIEGDDKRTSRTIMVQNSRTPGTLVHGDQSDGSCLTIGRVTAGIEFSQPIRPKWSGTAGLFFQHAGVRNEKGDPVIKDFFSSPLTASGKVHDDMLLAKFESVYTGSGDQGSSMFVVNMEQGLPVLPEWLSFNRVNARARKGVEIGPSRFLLSLSGGHVVGNFPPHEAFAIGGTNSVRGYEEGAVATGRSYAVGSGEISFPMLGPVGGVIFADYGTDLGSGPTVLGDPAGARLKPGSGYGYGFGIRVESPLGPLRLEYAFSDRHDKRFHFGVGYRT
ncbi:outer envelope protein 80, chloroplastic-like isoform X2 [Alnus glutinosa]|uniref:outer envelope protein 80, chloroplastic-like isoform X2 n=1 Tax=Alnus glutinosa TaxID=3517 RepID=UPI002D775670|nr:outer envelope protein 80, chloroplastic-like isoform X2 [Alnus glutinosa]